MKTLIFTLTTLVFMTFSHDLSGQPNGLVTGLTIDHIVKYPSGYTSENGEESYPLILALHGHGSNEQDLISLSSHLQENLFWVSGRGLHTLNKGSYDWYQLPPTPKKLAATLNSIHTFIGELIATYPIDPKQIYLLGFSQGSMVSLSYAMAYPNSIAGVIAQSGAIPSDFGLEIDTEGLKGKPIVITHGIEDPAMPILRGRQTRDVLVGYGAKVDFQEFHMGHSINNESLSAVKKWLDKQLN